MLKHTLDEHPSCQDERNEFHFIISSPATCGLEILKTIETKDMFVFNPEQYRHIIPKAVENQFVYTESFLLLTEYPVNRMQDEAVNIMQRQNKHFAYLATSYGGQMFPNIIEKFLRFNFECKVHILAQHSDLAYLDFLHNYTLGLERIGYGVYMSPIGFKNRLLGMEEGFKNLVELVDKRISFFVHKNTPKGLLTFKAEHRPQELLQNHKETPVFSIEEFKKKVQYVEQNIGKYIASKQIHDFIEKIKPLNNVKRDFHHKEEGTEKGFGR
jgi:hypothetical protein